MLLKTLARRSTHEELEKWMNGVHTLDAAGQKYAVQPGSLRRNWTLSKSSSDGTGTKSKHAGDLHLVHKDGVDEAMFVTPGGSAYWVGVGPSDVPKPECKPQEETNPNRLDPLRITAFTPVSPHRKVVRTRDSVQVFESKDAALPVPDLGVVQVKTLIDTRTFDVYYDLNKDGKTAYELKREPFGGFENAFVFSPLKMARNKVLIDDAMRKSCDDLADRGGQCWDVIQSGGRLYIANFAYSRAPKVLLVGKGTFHSVVDLDLEKRQISVPIDPGRGYTLTLVKSAEGSGKSYCIVFKKEEAPDVGLDFRGCPRQDMESTLPFEVSK